MNRYNLIYADPPWSYSNQATRAASYKSLPYHDISRTQITRHKINSVELFARQNVNGWDAWGNECKNDIELQEVN